MELLLADTIDTEKSLCSDVSTGDQSATYSGGQTPHVPVNGDRRSACWYWHGILVQVKEARG